MGVKNRYLIHETLSLIARISIQQSTTSTVGFSNSIIFKTTLSARALSGKRPASKINRGRVLKFA